MEGHNENESPGLIRSPYPFFMMPRWWSLVLSSPPPLQWIAMLPASHCWGTRCNGFYAALIVQNTKKLATPCPVNKSQQVVQSDRNHGRCRCNRHAVDSDTTKPFNSPSVSIVSTAGSGVLLVEWTMWRQRPSTSSLSPTRLAPIFSQSFNMKGASSAKAKLGYGKKKVLMPGGKHS